MYLHPFVHLLAEVEVNESLRSRVHGCTNCLLGVIANAQSRLRTGVVCNNVDALHQ